jgi:protein KRI1
LEQELERKVDEYWKLHYHKIAGGDVRTRFRYREVNPETFGLSEIDVLTKDDRQLNMVAPLNCYAAYLGRNENLRDRYKALHRRNSLREIASERKSRRYGDVSKTALFDESIPEEEGQKIAQAIHEKTKRLREDAPTTSAAAAAAAAAPPAKQFRQEGKAPHSRTHHGREQPNHQPQQQPQQQGERPHGNRPAYGGAPRHVVGAHSGNHRPRRQ